MLMLGRAKCLINVGFTSSIYMLRKTCLAAELTRRLKVTVRVVLSNMQDVIINLLHRIRDNIYLVSPEWGKSILKRVYWRLWFIRLDLKTRFGMLRGGTRTFKAGEIVYVNPAEIRYYIFTDNYKYKNISTIKGGDWDLRRQKFEDLDIFIALREHFENGVPFSKSKAHSRILKDIDKGVFKWGCKTEEELNDRWRRIEELYFDIKTKGYKKQKELGNANFLDEVTINIGRNGELLLEDGRHRLSIAKILGLESIPVLITRKHHEWVKFKAELLSGSEKGHMYQPLLHPDLRSISSEKGDKRASLILDNLPCHRGEVLDIGANYGYFCHILEDFGFTCYAVENNLRVLYFLNKLKSIGMKKFEVIPKSVFDVEKVSYDIVLALSIFHHFLKNEDDYHKLTEFLGKLDTKFMFFETHQTNEIQMRKAYINYNETEFIEYILSNSCLNTYTFLGRPEEDRGMYLLKR